MGTYPVWADGRLVEATTPVIRAEDEGFLLGLSVFDSILLEDGCLYFLEQHLARLERGAAELGIAWPPPFDARCALQEMRAAIGEHNCILRVTLTRGVPERGPSLIVTARDLGATPPQGVVVYLSSYRKLAGDALEELKSTNRLRNVLAREEAQAHGAWEALLRNHDGDISEGTISNLFVVLGGVLVTPPTERGCLSGIVREQILNDLKRRPLRLEDGRSVPTAVRRVEESELARAQEAFLTNTSGRVLPIVEVRGLGSGSHTLPGALGEVTRAVRERLRELEEAYRRAQAEIV